MERRLAWAWRRRRGVPPVNPPLSMPSLDLLLQMAMQERDNQIAHFDALDTKAGVVLGFDGVLIALSGGVRLEFELTAIALASASAIAALISFWPRKFPVLEPMEFRKFLTYEPERTRLKLHDTIATAVMRGGQVLRVKVKYQKFALLLLLAAALTFGAGIITTTINQNFGRAHHGTQKTTRGSTQTATPKPTRARASASSTP